MARGYGQFCPVAKAAEVFAQRWTPLLARELCFGPKRFTDLQGAVPLMSRSLLARRLDELEAAGLVAATADGAYALTPAGEGLRPIIESMSVWGQQWVKGAIPDDELDPGALMWGMRRQIDLAGVPAAGLVIRFSFRGLPATKASLRHWWLVLMRHDAEVCQKDPGREVDVVVEADLREFTEWWMGRRAAADAAEVAISGLPAAVANARALLGLPQAAVPKVFRFAPMVPA